VGGVWRGWRVAAGGLGVAAVKPRYAQENHTHAGLSGAADPFSGVHRAVTAQPASNTAIGFNALASATGTATAGTLTIGSPNALENRPRILYACTAAADGGLWGTPNEVNRVAGFRARLMFGMSTWNASARLFVGLNSGTGLVPALSADPAARLATGFGVSVAAGGSVFDWTYASGAIGTGVSVPSTVAFSALSLYALIVESPANGTTVTGTLLNVGTGASQTYTFGTLPPSTEMHRPVFVARGVASTTYMNFVRFDTYQDIDAQWSLSLIHI
jgi:hypothetical protein